MIERAVEIRSRQGGSGAAGWRSSAMAGLTGVNEMMVMGPISQ
jgi:hypothetical protein